MKQGAVASAAFGLLTTYVVTQYPNELRAMRNQFLLNLARSEWLGESWLDEQLQYVLKFEKRFTSMADKIPADRQRVLSCLIVHYLRLLNENQSSTYLSNFRQGIDDLFDLTLEYHEPLATGTSKKVRDVVKHDYPQVSDKLNNYINQFAQYLNDRENPKPHPLLLIGPPGVGKTRFVEEVLTREFNVAVHRVSLAKLTQDELTGERNANLCNKYHEGILMSALLAAKRKHRGKVPIVVFFDDICTAFTKGSSKVDEQVVLSWLTEITDPERKSMISNLYNRYGTDKNPINGIEFLLSDFIFVFAANSRHFVLTEGMDRRLRDNTITFPGMTKEKKLEIARTYSKSQETLAVHRLNKKNLAAGVFEAERAKLILTEQEQSDMDKIAKTDPYPGADTMKDTIDKYYANKLEGMPFDIEAHYQSLKPVEDPRDLAKTFTPGYRAESDRNAKTDASETAVDDLAKTIADKLSLLSETERLEKLAQLESMGLIPKSTKQALS